MGGIACGRVGLVRSFLSGVCGEVEVALFYLAELPLLSRVLSWLGLCETYKNGSQID